MVDESLLPAFTLMSGNTRAQELLWAFISRLPYHSRYRLDDVCDSLVRLHIQTLRALGTQSGETSSNGRAEASGQERHQLSLEVSH